MEVPLDSLQIPEPRKVSFPALNGAQHSERQGGSFIPTQNTLIKIVGIASTPPNIEVLFLGPEPGTAGRRARGEREARWIL